MKEKFSPSKEKKIKVYDMPLDVIKRARDENE